MTERTPTQKKCSDACMGIGMGMIRWECEGKGNKKSHSRTPLLGTQYISRTHKVDETCTGTDVE